MHIIFWLYRLVQRNIIKKLLLVKYNNFKIQLRYNTSVTPITFLCSLLILTTLRDISLWEDTQLRKWLKPAEAHCFLENSFLVVWILCSVFYALYLTESYIHSTCAGLVNEGDTYAHLMKSMRIIYTTDPLSCSRVDITQEILFSWLIQKIYCIITDLSYTKPFK